MKKTLLALALVTLSMTSMAQNVVTAEKNNQDAELCFYKQVSLKGYAYVNLVGKCAWDPAMNGLNLSMVAVSEDPTEDAQRIELGYIRNVDLVQNKSGQIQISISQDNFDRNDNPVSIKKVIYVRSVNPAKGTFSVVTK
jgi:hypothetical protein